MGELGLRKGGDVDTAHPDRPAVRLVDPRKEVQEGRFPGTGWSHQRQEFPVGDVEDDIVQDRDGEVFPVIGLEEMPDFYDRWFRFGQINSLRCFALLLWIIINYPLFDPKRTCQTERVNLNALVERMITARSQCAGGINRI